MAETLDNAENASVEHKDDLVQGEVEKEASRMGWVPQDKFRGDPERWVDAKSFLDRGNEVLPIVKAELRKTRSELEEVRKTAQEWQNFTKAAHERELDGWKVKYQEAISAKKEAVSTGDGEAYIAAEAAQKELEANRPKPKQEEDKLDPEFKAWLDENPWYTDDRKKRLKANIIGADLATDGLKGRALYDKVAEEMDKLDREATGTTRQGPQRGGKPAGGERKGARTYENLTPEARASCDKQFKYFGGSQKQDAWRESWVAAADETLFKG